MELRAHPDAESLPATGGQVARAGESIPTGTVTLLLGDLEGSVRLWESDAASMAAALTRLNEIVDEAAERNRGVRPLEQGEGDSFVLAFAGANDAARCALDVQLAVAKERWPGELRLQVRMAVHSGDVRLRDAHNYAGPTINRCARIRALAHGGQTLVSGATHDLVVEGLPDEASLRGLGLHRLRDLARPERLYQLTHPDLPGDFPPLRSLSALPNNLPTQLTSFVGRVKELRDVSALLSSARLLTLTGAGGCGKTRLALQAAADVPDIYPDGLWWVDLAPIAEPGAAAGAVAAALSVVQSPGEDVLPRLCQMIAGKSLLIILDNCEHLIDACAETATAILQATPGATVLATSREPLGVHGEVTYRVPSMPFPEGEGEGDALARFDAVRLFMERAVLARPNFRLEPSNTEAVIRICRQLDGIPLAIELAAARLRFMSPSQIADALTDRFRVLTGGARGALARQRTLEASVDWSYNLLGAGERALLARLSAFAGSFSIEAVEEVCAGGAVERYSVLELLAGLADRSLLQVEEQAVGSRYRLLETIRAYARDRLAAAGETEGIRHRHLEYFVARAVEAESALAAATHYEVIEALDAELPNIQAAIDWALASSRVEDAMRIVGDLSMYWLVRGRHYEMKRLIVSILDAAPDADPRLRLKTLWAGVLVSFTGDFAATLRFVEEAERLAESIGDEGMLGRALTWKGWCEYWIGLGPGVDNLRAGLALARRVGDPTSVARSLYFLGAIQLLCGAVADGEAALEEAIATATASGNVPGLAASLFFRAGDLCYRGEFVVAEELARRSQEISHAMGYGMFESQALWVIAHAALGRGRLEEARDAAVESLRVARNAGAPIAEATAEEVLAEVALAADDLEAARVHIAAAEEHARAAHVGYHAALVQWNQGRIERAAGDDEAGRRHLDAALARSDLYPEIRAVVLDELAQLERASGNVVAAESRAHEALNAATQRQSHAATLRVVETVAGIALDRSRLVEATRLLAASTYHSEIMGMARTGAARRRHNEDVEACRAALGDESFEAAWSEGARLSIEEAVTYALRGHGERARPSSGWASLTPAELQVVSLIAEGLTNPQIAERLFVSRNTVKAHLAHVFEKLGCSTRTEVAAEAVRRGI